ncbi:hypothetical protein MKX01_035741, partial [Papaver californicum]
MLKKAKKGKGKHLPAPPSKFPRHDKILVVGPFRGKDPKEIPNVMRECANQDIEPADSSSSSASSIPSATSDHDNEQTEAYVDEIDGGGGGGETGGSSGGGGGDNGGGSGEASGPNGGGGGGGDDDDDNDGGDDDGGGGDEEAGKPKAPSGRHTPSTRLLMGPDRNGKARSLPLDGGKVLFAYLGSWAHTICDTIDHTNATYLFKHQSSYVKMMFCPLEGECARVRALIKNSGLYPNVQNSIIDYDRVVISCFRERFYPEIDCFRFPFGEMALTPHDAENILGLQVEGKSTMTNYKKKILWETIYRLAKALFGWDEEATNDMLVKGPKYQRREFNL